MQIVSVRLSVPASLRSAWLISRACRPTWLSPISPSISAFGVERGDRVDRDDVERAGADEQLGDLERLLAGVGLRDEELVDVDADPARVLRVHRVLGVDEGADAAAALRLGDHVVDERRLARGLRAEDLDDAAARQAADAEREVERERARRDGADRDLRPVAHLHDRALAELPLDLAERDVESFLASRSSVHPTLISSISSSRTPTPTHAQYSRPGRAQTERKAAASDGPNGPSVGQRRPEPRPLAEADAP